MFLIYLAQHMEAQYQPARQMQEMLLSGAPRLLMRDTQLPVTLGRSRWLRKLHFVLPHSPFIIGADVTTQEELSKIFFVLNKNTN